MPITERDLLDEIGNIIHHNDVHGSTKSSRDSARVFFDPLELPKKLQSYIKESRHESTSRVATMLRMSPNSLKRIVEGGPLSENMLFRIRNSLEYAIGHPGISVDREGDTYYGDWRKTNTAEIQKAISDLAMRLIFLSKLIESSNMLNSTESPIDKIQIAQVIALLESTLAAIKAPLVEVGQASGFLRLLKKFGKKAVEKGVEVAVTHAVDSAVSSGSDFLHKIGDAAGTSDIGTIIN